MNSDSEKQMAQAEEILGDRLAELGFAKGLFFGHYRDDDLPHVRHRDREAVADMVQRLTRFCHDSVDPVAIDRLAEIPAKVIEGLGNLGVLGACLPKACGGLELSQTAYCRLLEVLGGHCASTALFVNAHHSIGPRALVLFGNEQQQARYLPKLATGEWISAFALTEAEAGSDAANVQTLAVPSPDGRGYVLNGEKRWITNGGLAQVLTVMARTPIPGSPETKITAFLVTPDMPGFAVLERRMEKCGVRGTATSRLAFRDMFVPRENILGELGKGLKVALTVLDYGRTTFGASCTGAAKFCLQRALAHSRTRVQFQQPLANFELVKQKLAWMQAGTVAMEACTYVTAALIDQGEAEFMLETAMLKVFATETLWRIIHDTFQLHGGKAYFTDEPFERMLRDARINMIGEGANDVLRAFVALVGLRDAGLEMEAASRALEEPFRHFRDFARFSGRKFGDLLIGPAVPVHAGELEADANRLSRDVRRFGWHVTRLLATYQREILDRQYQLGRIADAAIELYVSACLLRWLDDLHSHLRDEAAARLQFEAGRYYLRLAHRQIARSLDECRDNDDEATTRLADHALKTTFNRSP